MGPLDSDGPWCDAPAAPPSRGAWYQCQKKKFHDEDKELEDKRGHLVMINEEKCNYRCNYSCQVRISIFH